MIEHVTDLLGAYLDGELHGLRLRQVEEHLEKCAACRKELAEMRHLSTLLQESYPVEAFMPADRFAANMVLRLSGQEESRRLPRQAGTAPSRKPLDFIWWLVPAGMLGAWVFVQAVFTVSSLVSTADLAGLFGNTSRLAAERIGAKPVVLGQHEPVRQPDPGKQPDHPRPAEQFQRFRDEPGGAIAYTGRHRPGVLDLAGTVVETPAGSCSAASICRALTFVGTNGS